MSGVPGDLVHLRCSPEPELGVARLCRSAKDPAKSPHPPHWPPHGASLRMESDEKIASGPAGRHSKSSIITTLCSRPVCLRSILNLGRS